MKMENQFTAGAVVYARDVVRVSRFYAALAGLSVTREDAGFVVLESPAFQLTVVAVPPAIAQRITIASPPVRRQDTALKLCFAVTAIEAARATAQQFGGTIDGPAQEWTLQDWRVCDGHDPEGNVIQVRAHAA
jgi:predicted enzyme related to lactoylglutathione lyase